MSQQPRPRTSHAAYLRMRSADRFHCTDAAVGADHKRAVTGPCERPIQARRGGGLSAPKHRPVGPAGSPPCERDARLRKCGFTRACAGRTPNDRGAAASVIHWHPIHRVCTPPEFLAGGTGIADVAHPRRFRGAPRGPREVRNVREVDSTPRHSQVGCSKPCLAVLIAAEHGAGQPLRCASGVSDGLA